MAGYGWDRGRFPGAEEWGRSGGGRVPRYDREFERGSYGRGGSYGRDSGGYYPGFAGRYDRQHAPPQPPMDYDGYLRAAVRRKLFEDTWLDARNIQVDAEDGVIYLSGTVSSHLESRYAWDDAWETEGVRGVVTRLDVGEADGGKTRDDG